MGYPLPQHKRERSRLAPWSWLKRKPTPPAAVRTYTITSNCSIGQLRAMGISLLIEKGNIR